MSLPATVRLDGALRASQSLLLPVDAGTWARLLVLVDPTAYDLVADVRADAGAEPEPDAGEDANV